MTTSRCAKGAKSIKREHQRITRTACEPCREKRAKCNGEKPCGRCQTRSLDCHFTQRKWASKRSLQDEVASLREQVQRRDRLLDAICAMDASGHDVVRMLRDGGVSYDEAYEEVQGSDAGSVTLDMTMGEQQSGSSTPSQSSFSFTDSAIGDDIMPRPSTNIQQQQPQQSDPLRQQMNPMQSIPWAAPASDPDVSDVDSFCNILDSTSPMQPISSDIAGDCPTVFDPMLWAPVNSSGPPGQPVLNSWFSLMTDPTDRPKSGTVIPCAT